MTTCVRLPTHQPAGKTTKEEGGAPHDRWLSAAAFRFRPPTKSGPGRRLIEGSCSNGSSALNAPLARAHLSMRVVASWARKDQGLGQAAQSSS